MTVLLSLSYIIQDILMLSYLTCQLRGSSVLSSSFRAKGFGRSQASSDFPAPGRCQDGSVFALAGWRVGVDPRVVLPKWLLKLMEHPDSM